MREYEIKHVHSLNWKLSGFVDLMSHFWYRCPVTVKFALESQSQLTPRLASVGIT